jgi:hypothetical protein
VDENAQDFRDAAVRARAFVDCWMATADDAVVIDGSARDVVFRALESRNGRAVPLGW